jgi:spore germination protein GerM
MTRGRVIAAAVAVLALALAWLLFIALPGWVSAPRNQEVAGNPTSASAEPERRIKARLFYLSPDGHGLSGVERDVAYGSDPAAQAKAILEAQIAPAAEPLVSAVPAGTKLRAVFVANGDAYVDLTQDVVTAHPGGSLNEQLTIYTLVSAILANLPAVTGVQILIEGKEVDTLAGHVDLRQPLVKNPEWVQ